MPKRKRAKGYAKSGRDKEKRVECLFDGSKWRAGKVTRSDKKTFWVKFDDDGTKEKIEDKAGYWRPEKKKKKEVVKPVAPLPSRFRCKLCTSTNDVVLTTTVAAVRIPTCNKCEVDGVQGENYYHCPACDGDECLPCFEHRSRLKTNEIEADAPKTAAKKTKKTAAAKVAPVKVPLLEIVTKETKASSKRKNVIVQSLRGDGWKFGGPLVDYRRKTVDGNPIRGSLGWVLTSAMDVGSRKFRVWQDVWSKASTKMPSKLTIYRGAICCEAAQS